MSEYRIGVRDLKARLSEYLRLVKQGNTVLITEHGRPIGRLTQVELALEDRIKNLQEAGLLAWNGKKLPPTPSAAVNRGNRQASEIVIDLRK